MFQEKVDYLGHLVSAEGIRPQEEYLRVVKDWQIPSTKSEARVFLGKVGYYRRFIKNYSKIARPWTDVTGVERTGDVAADKAAEKAPLQITPEMRSSFTELKSRLVQAPVLAYPRFHSDEPFILDTDWSQESGTIGGVLSQVQDGKERAILYGAKKLSQVPGQLRSDERRVDCSSPFRQSLEILPPTPTFHLPNRPQAAVGSEDHGTTG